MYAILGMLIFQGPKHQTLHRYPLGDILCELSDITSIFILAVLFCNVFCKPCVMFSRSQYIQFGVTDVI